MSEEEIYLKIKKNLMRMAEMIHLYGDLPYDTIFNALIHHGMIHLFEKTDKGKNKKPFYIFSQMAELIDKTIPILDYFNKGEENQKYLTQIGEHSEKYIKYLQGKFHHSIFVRDLELIQAKEENTNEKEEVKSNK